MRAGVGRRDRSTWCDEPRRRALAPRDLIRPTWRKVLADLWAEKTRTLLVVLSIAVGAFAIGAMATNYAILSEDIQVSYAAAQPANIAIETEPFDQPLVETIRKLPGVLDAEGRQVAALRTSPDGRAWKAIQISAGENLETARVNLLTPVAGRPYPADRELVVREDLLNTTGLEPGDVADVMLPDGTLRSLPVVGTVGDQYAAGKFALPPGGYVTLETMPWLGSPAGFNRLYIRAEEGDDEEAIARLAHDIEEQLRQGGREVFNTETSAGRQHPLEAMLLAIVGILGVLGVLIMLLSTSLVFNTLSALLRQHRRQIGVMKLVGGRSLQIAAMYTALILLYGLLALLLAVVPGIVAGYRLSTFMGGMMSINIQGFRVVPLALALQVVLALVVPLLAGYFPVRTGTRLSVRRALGVQEMSATASAWIFRLSLWLPGVSRPLLLSIRNTFRQRGRVGLTLFTLTLAGAIFIAIFNVRDSLNGFVETLGQLYLADVTVTLAAPERSASVARDIGQVEGVARIESWAFTPVDVLDAADERLLLLYLMAPPEDTEMLDPELVAGRWLLPEDDRVLVVSDRIWDALPEFQVGDTLRLEAAGHRPEEWPVVGIFRFIDLTGIDLLGYANFDPVTRWTGTPDRATMFRVATRESSLESQQALSEVLDQYLRGLGYHLSDIEVGQVARRQQTQTLNVLVVFLLAMAGLTAFVGTIGLAGTMAMNVLERTREIGVMRAIGAVDGEIVKSVVVEGLLIGLLSFVAAALLSFPISFLLLRIISTAVLGTVMQLEFTPSGFLIWLVMVIVLAVVASVWPARSAARLTIREVLAYE